MVREIGVANKIIQDIMPYLDEEDEEGISFLRPTKSFR